ncbi:MAG: DUF748 domain-containing protein [Paludibacteraceae bacterium]|nr:DUF748 domain-containing protein [Paludibacteraceae bacterium]
MNKSIKITCWVFGVPVALLLLVMALSPVVKLVVNNHGQDILGRDLSVKRVFVNPFFGTVTIKDFHCKEVDGEADFVAFERLHVQMNWPALIGKHVNLNHIHLDDFSGEVLSGNSEFNFSDIIERFASKDTTAKDTTPSSWTVSLQDIRLHNGQLLYHDTDRDKKWSLDNINLNVPGLYFGRQQSNAGLQFDLPTGGSVTITAGYIMASNRYAVTLRLDEVNTNVALPLVQDYLKISGLGALITGSIHVDGSLDNVRDLVATGNLSLKGLKITDERHNPIAGLDEVKVVIRRGDVATNTFALDTLAITGITCEFERTKKDNTLSRLLREPEERPADTLKTVEPDTLAPVESEPVVEAPLTWSTDHLLITGRDITFMDRSMRKRFTYAIDTLTLAGENIVSHGKNTLKLNARLSDGGKLNATYTGGLDLKVGLHKLGLKLTNVKLKGFTAYTEHLFACSLTNGDLAVQVDGTINNAKLVMDTKITMDQPEVGKKAWQSNAKLKNVPLKLGIDMLKSAQGIVLLDVPVKGDINSPKFKLGKVFGRALAKVFFGPLMGARDGRSKISHDEMEEMIELLGSDTTGMNIPDPEKSRSKKRKRE